VLSVSTYRLLSPPSLILWHALLAVPLHLTRCRKIFFTADGLNNLVRLKYLLNTGCCHRPVAGALLSWAVSNLGKLPLFESPEIEPKRPSVGTTRVAQP
jgi:hypothetical protein